MTHDNEEPSAASAGSQRDAMNIVDIANYRVTSGQESDTHSDVQIMEKLLSMVRSLQTCEKFLQGQVADRDATIESLRLEMSQTTAETRVGLPTAALGRRAAT